MEDVYDIPMYTPADASRLVGLTSSRVHRWLNGYQFLVGQPSKRRVRRQSPVVKRDENDSVLVSFLDLMELRFISAFLDHGISLQKVRRALTEASNLYPGHHPFARRIFYTDGREIYVRATEGKKINLLQLCSGGQWVIPEIILEYANQMDFSPATEFAERWYPLGRTGHVVVDPRLAYGAPVIVGRTVKTENIFDLFIAQGKQSKSVVAWYGLTDDEVEAAVRFELARAA